MNVLWYGIVCLSISTSVRPSVRSVVYNHCGQDVAQTMWPRMLKLSVYTSYGKRKTPIYFQRSVVKFQGQWTFTKIMALGSVWAGYSKNYAVSVLKLSMYTSYGSGRSQLNFKVKSF